MPASPTRDIIVIGASAGGLDAVTNVVRSLPSNLAATVFIVIHTSPEGPGLLPDILGRLGTIPVTAAQDGERIVRGHIYVPPPDFHLLVADGHVRLSHGPREHRFRPAVDPLFRSAAEHYGTRVIGVVLSGSMADGTHGLMLIKGRGGVAIVQDPNDAVFPGMPRSAIERVHVDHVLPSEQIGAVITELTMVRAARPPSRAKVRALSSPPSPFTCPDCGGTLWELKEGKLLRYRCRVGHGFSGESLAAAQENTLEETLWSALRAIEESIALRRRLLDRSRGGPLATVAPGVTRDIGDLEQRATALRELLLSGAGSVGRHVGMRRRRSAGSTRR